ncbi:lysophospholipid acyltransferase family protein [Stieleria sp. TO1_6]|uniref:lysophospholipid acyltransferase family protein n=1 Tax=Stieleria tagensis TaxID=2956795 RepID=UPI00209B1C09|nr:lysophospholipid acyltransferase family protein [Stieleria tagensis]MCO8122062.1 lysophospholipid acyltransferase family protein [Stieleria tagensis]
MKRVMPYLVLAFIKLLRVTCRVRPVDDPRDELRAAGQPYIYAGLHAQQIAMVTYAENGAGSLVSRSKDGDLIAKALESVGAVPIRGSSGSARKGGVTALRGLVNHVAGGLPACLAVDGPKGPRGVVNPGIALLSQKTGAPVLPISLYAHWRKIFPKTWDRTQLPMPFSRIDGTFAKPIYPRQDESVQDYALRIQAALLELERRCDPVEAAIAQQPATEPIKSDTAANRAA